MRPDTGAARCGLLSGDILTHICAQPVLTKPQFFAAIASICVGDVLDVRVRRQEERLSMQLRVGAQGCSDVDIRKLKASEQADKT